MPYKNIVFIQLQKRLLNDPRWFMMSYSAQLLLIKVWLALASYDNRLTKDEVALTSILRIDLPIGDVRGALQEIKKNYPNFKSNKHFYYWKGFDEYTNYIYKGKSRGNPKEIPRVEHIDIHIDKHKDIDSKEKPSAKAPLSDLEFIENLKKEPIYKHIDFEFEFRKMDKWLTANPNRKKTRRFIVNWLNKIDRPIYIKKESNLKFADTNCKACSGTGFVFNQVSSTNQICQCRIIKK